MFGGSFHIHVRKRIHAGHPFPSRRPFLRRFDYLMYIVAIFAPLALVPQIVAIYGTRDVSGLALPTWIMLGGINLLWTIYGILHRSFPVVLANALFFLLHIVGVIGILLFA